MTRPKRAHAWCLRPKPPQRACSERGPRRPTLGRAPPARAARDRRSGSRLAERRQPGRPVDEARHVADHRPVPAGHQILRRVALAKSSKTPPTQNDPSHARLVDAHAPSMTTGAGRDAAATRSNADKKYGRRGGCSVRHRLPAAATKDGPDVRVPRGRRRRPRCGCGAARSRSARAMYAAGGARIVHGVVRRRRDLLEASGPCGGGGIPRQSACGFGIASTRERRASGARQPLAGQSSRQGSECRAPQQLTKIEARPPRRRRQAHVRRKDREVEGRPGEAGQAKLQTHAVGSVGVSGPRRDRPGCAEHGRVLGAWLGEDARGDQPSLAASRGASRMSRRAAALALENGRRTRIATRASRRRRGAAARSRKDGERGILEHSGEAYRRSMKAAGWQRAPFG